MRMFVSMWLVSNDTANAKGNSEDLLSRNFDLAYSAEAL